MILQQMSKSSAPVVGQLGSERDRFLRGRVKECQTAGMEGDGRAERVWAAVFLIAVDGAAPRGQLHAKLMLATCVRAKFEPRQMVMAAADLEEQPRELGTRRVRW